MITNEDVKKSKGKIVVLPPSATPEPEQKGARQSIVEQHDEQYRTRRAATERFAAAEKKVAELERELFRLEQNFYDANDPNYRDDVIQKRFDQTRRQLDGAKKDLADARDALGAANPRP